MTRNWIAKAARTLMTARTGSARRHRPRTTPRLENLEDRLSLSSMNAGGIVVALLNPQPLPPGRTADLNPQPIPPGRSADLNPQPLPPRIAWDLNPQPLPPGFV